MVKKIKFFSPLLPGLECEGVTDYQQVRGRTIKGNHGAALNRGVIFQNSGNFQLHANEWE